MTASATGRAERPGDSLGVALVIAREQVYRGPNVWTNGRAVNLSIDVQRTATSFGATPVLANRLMDQLPELLSERCSLASAGTFADELSDGISLPHVVEHVLIALQRRATGRTHHGMTRHGSEPSRHHVIAGYDDAHVALEAGRAAVRITNQLVEPSGDFDTRAEIEHLVEVAARAAPDPSTQALLDEAAARNVPHIRLDGVSFVQFGQGTRQRRVRGTITSGTSVLAVHTAADKQLAGELLRSVGLPMPTSAVVRTADEAAAAAFRIGFPVVVKPARGTGGRGVSLGVARAPHARAAFECAQEVAPGGAVLVEQQLPGRLFRLLVVGGRVVAVAERRAASVVGDGVQTVRALVDVANADPRRGLAHERELTRFVIDDAATRLLRAQGLHADDVPAPGHEVQLACTASTSSGGTSIDRTLDAHPDIVSAAEEAAEVLGLDVAGVDVVTPDITSSIREVGGIIEVNAGPELRIHTHPIAGDPQDVAKPILDLLFPPGAPSRIPIVAVTGTNGKTTTTRMLAHILKSMGRKVGMTSTDGIFVDQRRLAKYDASGPQSAQMVLQNPRVDFGLFEVARGGILRAGLGYEHNDVAVVLNIAPDHLGIGGVDTLEQLAHVKGVIVRAVPRDGTAVLNADDPLVAAMQESCNGATVFFTMQSQSHIVESHCRRGGRALVLERRPNGDAIVVRSGSRHMQVVLTEQVPATFGGRALMNVQNAMAAAGAAIAIGASLDDVRHGLRSFETSYFVAPGRLNVTELDGSTIVIDYAHNAPAMRTFGDFVERLAQSQPVDPRRVAVIGTPGDRRRGDVVEYGAVAAHHFDTIVIYEGEYRGRDIGETACAVAEGISASVADGARCSQVEVVIDQRDAAARVLSLLRPGDIGALCMDAADQAWNVVEERRKAVAAGRGGA